jgi:Kef-type K+ transport system membrane component KefB
VAQVLVALIFMLGAAKLGGDLFERLGLPAVLGELTGGIVLGNLHLLGVAGLEFLTASSVIAVLAELGVILLLFQVGLESTVKEMLGVGVESFLVALLGVVTPFFLGWGVAAWFLPGESMYVHIFIGATLCATSVGLTARVLKDLGRSQTREARIILGAAVIDDVMGLIILAGVVGLIQAAGRGIDPSPGLVLGILFKSTLFLVGALALGVWLSPRLFGLVSRMKVSGMLVSTALIFCFLLAWLSWKIGLAPIVGAFAAGLILEEVHFKDFREKGEAVRLEELLTPIGFLLVPLFFVRMGAQVDLTTFSNSGILGFALVLTLAAIAGKQVCSLGVLSKGTNRIAVGLGMIPRGEVGLIFIGIGAALKDPAGHAIIAPETFSAVVIMVIVTTMVTPPVLKWGLMRKG